MCQKVKSDETSLWTNNDTDHFLKLQFNNREFGGEKDAAAENVMMWILIYFCLRTETNGCLYHWATDT